MASIANDIAFLCRYIPWQRNVPDTEAFMQLWGSRLVKNAIPPQALPPSDPVTLRTVNHDIDNITQRLVATDAITAWDDPFWTLCRELHIVLDRYYRNRPPRFLWCIYNILLRARLQSWIEVSHNNTIRLLQARLPPPNNPLSGGTSDFILDFIRRYNHNPGLVYRILQEILFPHSIFLT